MYPPNNSHNWQQSKQIPPNDPPNSTEPTPYQPNPNTIPENTTPSQPRKSYYNPRSNIKRNNNPNFTPLNTPRSVILQKVETLGILQPPRPMFTPPERRNPQYFCAFHKDIGHTTDACSALKYAVESALQQGHLTDFLKHHPNNAQEHTKS